MKFKWKQSCCLSVMLAVFLLAIFSPNTVQAAQVAIHGSVTIDGKELKMDPKPIVINGSVMVPFRQLFTALGLTIDWVKTDEKTQTVTGKNDADTVIQYQVSASKWTATLNGKEIELTQGPFIDPETSTLYVNLRFISESVGAAVSWNNIHKIASIDTVKNSNSN
ncbi:MULTISPECIES: copper amine oxidase N-terminal domain-containing protein [Paenibacillus]|uniref:copper amine oxidase N-terminal domain-containing protein n=1 Tax=Paenibacillus TaxID=44249 RepID=UPI0011802318|nr:copper amine oxidase N-terminal domain-containing protein [Paenibacillus rhizosphaerae]